MCNRSSKNYWRAGYIRRVLNVFRSRKMAAILVLGFSSGLPLYLTSRTLQAWMTVAGVDLTTIGLFSLVGLPYSLKFLWSPLIDRFSFPFLGRRKGWLFTTQAALAAGTALMFFAQPPSALRFVAITALVIAFLSATQDITIDAYTTDISETSEVGASSGAKILGYRVALIATGGGTLILADYFSWQLVYLIAALLMLALAVVCTRVAEPTFHEKPPSSLRDAAYMPLVDFFKRTGASQGACILAFVLLYRLGDSMINNMTTPFLLQTGFSKTDVGVMQGAVGIIATIAGVLAGGAAISSVGINRSLWIFGVLQGASNLVYLVLAYAGRQYAVMAIAIVVENVCYGLATAALVGFVMSLCNPRFSATQYALLSSLIAVGRDVIAAPSGSIAQHFGWPAFFVVSIVAALPGMMLLPFFAPWNDSVRELVEQPPVDAQL
jgi:MFS transporter, PAT family, beta-lactamase induction signal transducer AmpG